MWRLRIEQYFQVQDYAIWDVIENGNSFKLVAQTTTNTDGTSTSLIPGPITTEEKTQKKNDVKARSMLLMALPNEHLMTFNQYKDAKTLFAAIQTRFGGKEATKKTQKTLLKQILVLANTQDSPLATQVSTASTQVNTANLSDDIVYAFLASQPNGSQLVYEDLEQIHEDDIEEMDLKWQLLDMTNHKVDVFNSPINGEHFARKLQTDLGSQVAETGIRDISRRLYMADDEVPTNMALMAWSDSEVHNNKTCLKSFETLKTQLDDLRIEFNKFEFNLATYKIGLAYVEEQLVFYKKNEVIFCEQLAVLKRDISYKDSEISMLKRSQITDKSRKGVGFVSYNAVLPPPTGLFSPLKFDLSNSGLKEFQQPEFEGYGPKTSKNVSEDNFNEVRKSPDAPLVKELVSANCNYHQRERVIFGNNFTRVNYNYFAKKSHSNAHRNKVPRAVLMKSGLRSLNTARHVTTAHPKTTVYSARPNQNVNTAKGKFYTARPKAFNTAKPNSAVVNAVRENQVNVVKASACWVWRPTKFNKDQGYVDSGCSRYMTRNMSYLLDFKEFDRGYVTLGGGAKGGKISVSQTCDKKNSVVIRNKARLVAQGYTKEERIDYDEVFAPIARIEALVCESRVSEMKTNAETGKKVDSSKALDASLVDTEKQWDNIKRARYQASRSRNVSHADDLQDIRPIFGEEKPMA
ncbi:ribonuclease H-like domain-containing protein [Tanacetum coccineum]